MLYKFSKISSEPYSVCVL